ncbi:hypothetical protein [Blastococcus sp. SYSU DS0619]
MSLLPVEHLRRYYDGLVADEPDAKRHALSMWSDDCTLHVPGCNLFSGAHPRAKEWMASDYLPALAAVGTVRQKEEYFSLVGDERFGLSHYRETFALPQFGVTLAALRYALYEFEEDRIVSIRLFETNPAEVDEFFNTYFPVATVD